MYLTAAAAALGLALYLSSFGPLFTAGGDFFTPTLLDLGVVAALLAALIAGVGLLPKQKATPALVAVLSVLGFLLVILIVLTVPDGVTIDWGLYLIIAFGVLQAIVAVTALLFDAGVITQQAPKPRYEQQYGQYGGPGASTTGSCGIKARRHSSRARSTSSVRDIRRSTAAATRVAGRRLADSPAEIRAGLRRRPPVSRPTASRRPARRQPLRCRCSRNRRHRRSPAPRRRNLSRACVNFARVSVRGSGPTVQNPPHGGAPGQSGTRQARELLRVAFGPSIVALVVIAAVVLLQLLIANSDTTGALGAIASMWLGVHQVPVSIGGRELGVMPLLPVLAMVWGTARTTAAATSLPRRACDIG